MREWSENQLKKSKFGARTGNHLEQRTGLLNFSIVGRNCTLGERQMYVQWDLRQNERTAIAEKFNEKFKKKKVVAQVAGETGIDIMEKNTDKASILRDVSVPIIFFGDKTKPGGNDWPLANALKGRNDCHTIAVKDWKDTNFHLKNIIKDVQKHLNMLESNNKRKKNE